MNNKLFIISAIFTSIVGFSGGFFVTKTIVALNTKESVVLMYEDLSPKNTDLVASANKAEEKVEVKKDKPVSQPNSCPKPKKDYEDESYLNVDQNVSLLDKTYIPAGLTRLDKTLSKSEVCIKEEVAEALKVMFEDASKDGYTIVVSSGFRDYATQKSIVDRETKNGNKNVSVSVAKPGYSEHQLGVAVDLTSKSIAYASASARFGDTKESVWLEEHASEYGFVQSYPKGKQKTTGYIYEPWHYRYVGIDEAKEIIKSGQTLNEYLKEKNKKDESE